MLSQEDAPPRPALLSHRQWANGTVRLAVALAFADASIVVLALPEVVVRLHTSISHVTWVIMSYNLALIVASIVAIPLARRLPSTQALIGGLVLFGLASIGCGLANKLSVLVALRSVQGAGGGVLLAASLPVFAESARPGDSPAVGWAAAAAIGVAVGPAAGGVLTQLFDWRSIFLAQAPVAALAVILVLTVGTRSDGRPETAPTTEEPAPGPEREKSALDPLTANVGLTLLSAGLICALFLIVVVLIDVWLITPIAAALVVSTIPLATAFAERGVRGTSPFMLGAVGAVLVAAGLLGLSFVTHKEIGSAVIALAVVGIGLGLAFPGLTSAALGSVGHAAARAAKTVAARDAGIVLGLLVLTPVFVNQLNKAPNRALPAATKAVVTAPLSLGVKAGLVPGLLADYKRAPQSELPKFHPTFEHARALAGPRDRVALSDLERQLDSIVQRAATSAFKLPLRYGALFAIAVLPLLLLGAALSRRRSA